MKLTDSSDRLKSARRFGLELRRALDARDYTIRGFAIQHGVARTRIQNWLAGQSLPPVETAQRMADILMWPVLVDLCRAGRMRTCDNCAREFIVETAGPVRYCSSDCKRFHAVKVQGSRDLGRAVLERRLRRHMAAVADMCADCEPALVCRTASCPLQVAGVSPLPLAKGAVA